MRLVQFEHDGGRRLGIVDGETVFDVTAARPELQRVVDAFDAADRAGSGLEAFLQAVRSDHRLPGLAYAELLENVGRGGPAMRPPVDHADPHRVLVTGTGLTHLGSMKSRDQMHAEAASQAPVTDSRKMFELGLAGGKPAAGSRGAAPEWFYKGSGAVLRGHGQTLAIPPFALDGGEEPEIVGCYIIDRQGNPRRLGFALGNEWSDHATESINYLYLAPSKMRECSIGPELITDHDFQSIELRCTVRRRGEVIYDSGPLLSGEQNMCHALANCEDHHFKYPQHRQPGDVHIHYFGTSKLSHRERTWRYEQGDEITVAAPGFSSPLVNVVTGRVDTADRPIRAEKA